MLVSDNYADHADHADYADETLRADRFRHPSGGPAMHVFETQPVKDRDRR
jgi:hypothetical protein